MFAITNNIIYLWIMTVLRKLPWVLAFSLIVIPGFPQNGADLFKRSCAPCHSIGSGKLVGPDLAGITQKRDKTWLTRFIKNSAEVIKSGDAAAVAIGKEYNNLLMPPFAGTDPEIASIITYIGSKGGSAMEAVADTFLNGATIEHSARGKKLFAGMVPFQKAGMPCIGCHSVHDVDGYGGGLAKSLNLSYIAMKGSGMKALLASPPFPAMTLTYVNRPLTDQEIYDLAAYLKDVSQRMVQGQARQASVPFLVYGIAGWSLFILLLLGLWRLRKRLTVNHDIFSRQMATEK